MVVIVVVVVVAIIIVIVVVVVVVAVVGRVAGPRETSSPGESGTTVSG